MKKVFLFLIPFAFFACDPPAEKNIPAVNSDSAATASDSVSSETDLSCLNRLQLKTEMLGNTGYAMQMPFGFSVVQDNDSSFRVLAPFIHGENVSAVNFRKTPRPKIPGNQDQFSKFSDEISGQKTECIRFEAMDFSFVNADIPSGKNWINIRGGVKCPDPKIEKLQLDTLYCILRTIAPAR